MTKILLYNDENHTFSENISQEKYANVIRDDVSLYAMMIFTKCKNQEAYKIRTISPPNMVPVYKLDIYLIP